jgi:hypothetical protein
MQFLFTAILALSFFWSPPVEARSTAVRNAFKRLHHCPSTGKAVGPCPGWIIDHIRPLGCGGPDTPANMQWQTVADAKAKDKWELKTCGKARFAPV